MHTSQVVALLLTQYMNYWQIFSQFLPNLAQKFNQDVTFIEIIANGSTSVKNTIDLFIAATLHK